MKDLKKLRAAREAARVAALADFNKHKALADKGDALTAEETTALQALDEALDAHDAKIAAMDAEIAAEEKAARRAGLFMSASTASAIARGAASGMRSNEPNPEATFGFNSLAEFATAVRAVGPNGSGFTDPRLSAALPTSYNMNGGSAGEGALVPPAFREAIWEVVFAAGELLAAVNPEPSDKTTVQFAKDETTPWGASGVQAGWRSQGQQMTPSKLVTTPSQMSLHELYAFVTATDELLSDAPLMGNRLTVKAGQAIRFVASDGIMWGTGVGMPLGFMNAAAKIAVAKDAGQAAKTISVDNVSNAYSRLLAGGMAGAFWIANSDILPQLIKLQIGNQPIWTPPNAGLAGAPGGFLLGRPIMFTEHAQTLGTEGDLVLADPAGYFAATKGGIDFASSIHLFFDYGASAFRWTFRMGGQPFLSKPVEPKNGSNSKSHFVSIATRA